MYENGDIIESPYGHNVVRVPLSPTQVVWLATDEYRGHFSDQEVEAWGKKTTIQETIREEARAEGREDGIAAAHLDQQYIPDYYGYGEQG